MRDDVVGARQEGVQEIIDVRACKLGCRQVFGPLQHRFVFQDAGNAGQWLDRSFVHGLQENPGSADGAAQPAEFDVRIQHQPDIGCNIVYDSGFQFEFSLMNEW